VIGPIVCGAHAFVYVNSKPYARVFSISTSTAEAQREVRTVDSLEPAEEIPAGLTARVQMQVYRLHADGGAEGAGLTVPWADAPRAKYASLLVLDRLTDTVLLRCDRAKLTQQAWLTGKGFVTGTVSFNCMDFGNEVAASG